MQVRINDIFHFYMCIETNTMWEDTCEIHQWSPFHHFLLDMHVLGIEKKVEYLEKTLLENMYNAVKVHCMGCPVCLHFLIWNKIEIF